MDLADRLEAEWYAHPRPSQRGQITTPAKLAEIVRLARKAAGDSDAR